jgi:hypothetical protein
MKTGPNKKLTGTNQKLSGIHKKNLVPIKD